MNKIIYIITLIFFISCARKGDEIYSTAFDKKPKGVKVLNSLDAVVPIMDYAVMIHFIAPKEEIERISNGFETKEFSGYPSSGVNGVPEDWISEENINSCTLYEKISDNGRHTEQLYIDCKNGEALYVSYY